MKQTRRTLFAANTQLQAQLASCNHETRRGLKAKLAAARDENEGLKKQIAVLTARLAKYEPEVAEV